MGAFAINAAKYSSDRRNSASLLGMAHLIDMGIRLKLEGVASASDYLTKQMSEQKGGTMNGGSVTVLRPDGTPGGRVISIEEASYDGTELQSTHDRQGIRIDSDTAATLWRGERMDYDLGVHVLLQHAERSQNVSAETSEQIF